jgi:hypothetical protein
MRRVNGWLTIITGVLIPLSFVTGWIGSVTFVAVLSEWALVSSHWAGWLAARVECKQQADADVSEVLEAVHELDRRTSPTRPGRGRHT